MAPLKGIGGAFEGGGGNGLRVGIEPIGDGLRVGIEPFGDGLRVCI